MLTINKRRDTSLCSSIGEGMNDDKYKEQGGTELSWVEREDNNKYERYGSSGGDDVDECRRRPPLSQVYLYCRSEGQSTREVSLLWMGAAKELCEKVRKDKKKGKASSVHCLWQVQYSLFPILSLFLGGQGGLSELVHSQHRQD